MQTCLAFGQARVRVKQSFPSLGLPQLLNVYQKLPQDKLYFQKFIRTIANASEEVANNLLRVRHSISGWLWLLLLRGTGIGSRLKCPGAFSCQL